MSDDPNFDDLSRRAHELDRREASIERRRGS
jgi:hypothetical protein